MGATAFIYVAPARFEDILKLGFSHEPCDRVRAFHERWFEYFDLERGMCLAATDEKDARRIELELAHRLADHRACAPLVIDEGAGGFTEWYRGAYPALRAALDGVAYTGGYAPPESLAQRFRERLLREREHVFENSLAMFDAIDALGREPQAARLAARLHAMLDAYAAFGLDIDAYLPGDVRAWRTR